MVVNSIPSTFFFRHVTEYNGISRLAWRAVRWLTINRPVVSAYLGNYVMIVCYKLPDRSNGLARRAIRTVAQNAGEGSLVAGIEPAVRPSQALHRHQA